MLRLSPALLLLPLIAAACGSPGDSEGFVRGGGGGGDIDEDLQVVTTPLQEPACETEGPLFREGEPIDFLQRIRLVAEDRYSDAGGGGIAAFDFDHDGELDLLQTQNDGCNRLFAGDGQGGFEERPLLEELAACDRSTNGAVPGDLDRDGWQDLVLFHQRDEAHPHMAQVFLGGEDGFVAGQVLHDTSRSYGVHLADFDDDGVLDVFMANFFDAFDDGGGDSNTLPSEPSCNFLFLGLGDGTFADASEGLPPVHCEGAGMAASTVYNYDTDLIDLYVVNDKGQYFASNNYSRNVGGTFVDATDEVLFNDGTNAMGIAAGIFEGNLSFFITGGGEANILSSAIDGLFVDIAQARGVVDNDGGHMGWGGLWFDKELLLWDQGDFLDSPDVVEPADTHQRAVVMARGAGPDDSFERIDDGTSFFEPINGHGSLRVDIDHDGLPDIVKMQVDAWRELGVFFGNRCVQEGAVSVELFDRDGNPPVGIRLGLGEQEWIYGASMGLFGAAQPMEFFQGAGDLEIRWSSSELTVLPVEPGNHYVIRQTPDEG
jgi:hypothetical protein